MNCRIYNEIRVKIKITEFKEENIFEDSQFLKKKVTAMLVFFGFFFYTVVTFLVKKRTELENILI